MMPISGFQDTIIEQVVIPYLGQVHMDSDTTTREGTVKFIIRLVQDNNNLRKCNDLLEILEKVRFFGSFLPSLIYCACG